MKIDSISRILKNKFRFLVLGLHMLCAHQCPWGPICKHLQVSIYRDRRPDLSLNTSLTWKRGWRLASLSEPHPPPATLAWSWTIPTWQHMLKVTNLLPLWLLHLPGFYPYWSCWGSDLKRACVDLCTFLESTDCASPVKEESNFLQDVA